MPNPGAAVKMRRAPGALSATPFRGMSHEKKKAGEAGLFPCITSELGQNV